MHRLESACFLFAVCPKQWENASIVLPLALYLIGGWNGSNHPCRKPCTLILVYTINVIWSHFWAFFNRLHLCQDAEEAKFYLFQKADIVIGADIDALFFKAQEALRGRHVKFIDDE